MKILSKFMAIIHEHPLSIIMEHMKNGPLYTYLSYNKPTLTVRNLQSKFTQMNSNFIACFIVSGYELYLAL